MNSRRDPLLISSLHVCILPSVGADSPAHLRFHRERIGRDGGRARKWAQAYGRLRSWHDSPRDLLEAEHEKFYWFKRGKTIRTEMVWLVFLFSSLLFPSLLFHFALLLLSSLPEAERRDRKKREEDTLLFASFFFSSFSLRITSLFLSSLLFILLCIRFCFFTCCWRGDWRYWAYTLRLGNSLQKRRRAVRRKKERKKEPTLLTLLSLISGLSFFSSYSSFPSLSHLLR